MIFKKEAATPRFPKEHMGVGGCIVLAFQVENVNKARKELKTKGVDVFEGPKTTKWGQQSLISKIPMVTFGRCRSHEAQIQNYQRDKTNGAV